MSDHSHSTHAGQEMRVRWTLNEILRALHLPEINADISLSGISTDSRTIKPGDIYLALEGKAYDGHAFVNEAVAKGAKAIIVHHKMLPFPEVHHIEVPNTLKALHQIAKYVRSKTHAIVIAITGSVGKTTTKEMLAHVLGHFGPTVSAKGSFNNHWGVPLSLMQLEPTTKYGVFEIGMNAKGEISPLSKLIAPHIGIVTAIGEAHIGAFRSQQEIAVEKGSIFDGLESHRHNGLKHNFAIINGATPYADYLLKKASKKAVTLVCNTNYSADVTLLNFEEGYIERCGYTEVNAIVRGRQVFYKLPTIGRHFVENSLLVLAVCHALGLDLDQVCDTFKTFKLPAGRGGIHAIVLDDKRCITMIDDAYNANPTSMRAGLTTFANSQLDQPDQHILNPLSWIKSKVSGDNRADNKEEQPTFDAMTQALRVLEQGNMDMEADHSLMDLNHFQSMNVPDIENSLFDGRNRKIAILSDMTELGHMSRYYHKQIAALLGTLRIDAIFCCGPEMKHLFRILPLEKRGCYSSTPKALIEPLMAFLRHGDIIYVKGSKASRVGQIVDHFLQINMADHVKVNPFAK